MRKRISRGNLRLAEWLAVTARTRFVLTSLALLLTAVFVFSSAVPVAAQAGRKLRKKQVTRLDNAQPMQEQTQQPSSGSSSQTAPPQPSSDDQYIPLGVGPRQRLALGRVFEQLNLSEEQRLKLRQLRRETGNQVNVLARLRKAQEEALEEAIHGNNFDPKIVEKRASELAETSGEMVKLQAKILSEIRQIMTPEQAARFRDLMQREANRPFLPGRQQNPQ